MTFFPALGYLIIPTHPYCTLSYLILFHPTRSLVYHTQPVSLIPYSIFIKYSYPILPYPIILKLNRIDPRPKRFGSVHHQNLPRPKSPGRNDPNSVVCTAKMLKSFGLVYSHILRLKNVFWHEFTGKSEAVRILNTILHLYKILLPYTTLSYHIEIELNRPTAEMSRIGTPSKFYPGRKVLAETTQTLLLHSQNAEIIWTGLQSHSSAKKRFLARIYGKIRSSPHSIKM